MVDAYSKWIERHIMSNIAAPLTIEKLRQVFVVHGLPETVVTDNGPTFTSEMFSEFMDQNGIHHFRTALFHPASHGLPERAVQTVKDGLKHMEGGSMITRLSHFLFKYCLTPQTTTAYTPAEMLIGRRPRSRLDLPHKPPRGPQHRIFLKHQLLWWLLIQRRCTDHMVLESFLIDWMFECFSARMHMPCSVLRMLSDHLCLIC